MHLPELISDLAIMLLTAGVVTVIFKKIKQPLVLGYIVADFLIGPYMPFFFTVADSASISTWSEIGVIVLMFGLGLEFNLHKLAQVGGTAIITALTEVGGMLLIGFGVGQLLGWGIMDSVFLGGMLSMSSTTIIIKAFDELGVRNQGFAQLVFGTLVIEDIAGIFMMIILSTLSVSQSISGGALAMKLALLVLYLALWLILGIYLLPTLMNKATPLMNDETLLVSSLGICFGMVLLANALGFSSALGAFMAGSLLAGTVHAERVEHLTSGVKDLFERITAFRGAARPDRLIPLRDQYAGIFTERLIALEIHPPENRHRFLRVFRQIDQHPPRVREIHPRNGDIPLNPDRLAVQRVFGTLQQPEFRFPRSPWRTAVDFAGKELQKLRFTDRLPLLYRRDLPAGSGGQRIGDFPLPDHRLRRIPDNSRRQQHRGTSFIQHGSLSRISYDCL